LLRNLCDHGQDAGIRVVRVGATDALAQVAVKAFELADRTQAGARPICVLLFDVIVGQGVGEATLQAGDGLRLPISVLVDDALGALEGHRQVIGLPDGRKLLQDRAVTRASALGRPSFGELEGGGDVAQLME
jgi:hypothetical protein